MTVSDGIGRANRFFWAGFSTAGVTMARTETDRTEALGIQTAGTEAVGI